MTKRSYTRRTADQWQQHITDQQQSGLNIADYCKQHQLAASNFYTWRSKLSAKGTTRPLSSAPSDTDWFPISNMQSTAPDVNAAGLSVTLSLPGGISLTLRPA